MALVIRALGQATRWALYIGLAAVLAATVLWTYHAWMPVVVFVEHDLIEVDEDSATMNLAGFKVRALTIEKTGELAPRGWAYGADGRRRPVSLEPAPGTEATSYPLGWNDFGNWTFRKRRPGSPIAVAYSIEVAYLDGVLGLVREEIGPVAVR